MDIINQPNDNVRSPGDVFPNIQRKYGLRTRELGKTVLKGFLVALRNPDAYYYIVGRTILFVNRV